MNQSPREATAICLQCGRKNCICEKDIITSDDLRDDPEEGDDQTPKDRDPREDDRRTDLQIVEHNFK